MNAIEHRYKTLINALFPDFIFVFDREFNFRDIITPDGLNLFHNKEELIGSTARAIYSPEVSELFIRNINECLDRRQTKEIEYHLDLFGVTYYYQARLMPTEDDTVFALIRDIGDRVRRMNELLAARKRAEEADRMKSAFLANMSHEIRTPLNAIVGFTEVIVTEDDPKVRAQYMEVINTNNQLLLQLVNDILDLSRMDAGKYEMTFEKVDIGAILHEIEVTFHSRVRSDEVELRVEIPDQEIPVLTDRNRLMQVLCNFISNAIKNTPQGSITVRVAEEGNYLRFYVTDTGIGIPPEKLKAIFNRFEKVDDYAQGAGLGLTICKTLVQLLGGEINVSSQPGEGSTFSMTVPYRNAAEHFAARQEQGEKIGSMKELHGQARRKILIAESIKEDFIPVQEALGENYDISWAHNGEEAVSSFILDKPDLIFLNIQMPVMTGIEAAEKIRAISTSIPIIGITTNDFYVEQKWAMESGCNDVISKPYSTSKLNEIVNAFII